MKWLLLILLVVNAVLFVVQIKEAEKKSIDVHYESVGGAEKISLLNEGVRSQNENKRCVVIGEVQDDEVLTKLTEHLKAEGVEFDVRRNKESLASQFWVYTKGLNEEQTKKLNQKKIDHYVVAVGDAKGFVSLGLFENIDLAKALVGDLKKAGVEAFIKERNKTKQTIWVSFAITEILNERQLIEGVQALNINVGEIKEFFCKSIASEK